MVTGALVAMFPAPSTARATSWASSGSAPPGTLKVKGMVMLEVPAATYTWRLRTVPVVAK